MEILNKIVVSDRINTKPVVGDILSPVNGDIWYNSTTNKFRKHQNGVTTDLDTTGVGGGVVNVLTNNITFSFPTLIEDESVLLTVLSPLITNLNFKSFSFLPLISVDHENLDDFQWDNLQFNIENIIDNVSFDLRATAAKESWGNYNIKYIITY